jgi:hypothetical protein
VAVIGSQEFRSLKASALAISRSLSSAESRLTPFKEGCDAKSNGARIVAPKTISNKTNAKNIVIGPRLVLLASEFCFDRPNIRCSLPQAKNQSWRAAGFVWS